MWSSSCRRSPVGPCLDRVGAGTLRETIDGPKPGIQPMYMLEGIYIDVTHTDILERYGSVAAYLRDGLGLTEDELAVLKDVVMLDDETT